MGRGDVGASGTQHEEGSRALAPEEIVRLEPGAVVVLDQRRLPDERVELRLTTAAEVADAIRTMVVRVAPTIGVTAAYGMALAAEGGEDLEAARAVLAASRPTAVNLFHALETLAPEPTMEAARAYHGAEVERCRRMSAHAAELFAAGTQRAPRAPRRGPPRPRPPAPCRRRP